MSLIIRLPLQENFNTEVIKQAVARAWDRAFNLVVRGNKNPYELLPTHPFGNFKQLSEKASTGCDSRDSKISFSCSGQFNKSKS